MIPTLIAVSALATHEPSLNRALWMWHGKQLFQAEGKREFFDFVDAPKGDPSHAISVIFLGEVDTSNPQLGNLIQECHGRGLRVDYLCGESSWAKTEENSVGLAQVAAVLKFNASQHKACRFDGFQFDVEPYLLPGWPSAGLRAGYLKLLEDSKSEIREGKGRLLLGAAIPRWFDGPELAGLYREVLDRIDYVAVMDYVNTSSSFVKDAANTVAYADKRGKQAWLGAEASELPDEPVATFYAKGNAAMENAFAAAGKAYSNSKGFAGVAVEYYETYLALRP